MTDSNLPPLTEEDDWEMLPDVLQDAVDSLLIDEVQHEKADAIDFDTVLAAEA